MQDGFDVWAREHGLPRTVQVDGDEVVVDSPRNTQRIAKWTDERGHNELNGLVRSYQPLVIFGTGPTSAGHTVTVPDDADVYRPARPVMVFVGKAGELR